MHPVQYDVDYAEQRDRVTTFFRLILLIPHAIVAALWGAVVGLATIGQWFVILFTGARNEGIVSFQCSFLRYFANVASYQWVLHDHFPAFSADDPATPVKLTLAADTDPPNRLSNALRAIWAIPALVIGYLLNIAGQALTLLHWLVIVFTGKSPQAIFDFARRVQHYGLQTFAYGALLTDRYPSFR